MPTEYRRIVFPNRELRQALLAYETDAGHAVPPGEIVALAVLDSPAAVVRITLLDAAQNITYSADFTTAHVAEALIRYCLDTRVPLPRDSRKSLRLMGDNLALDIVMRERNLLDLDGARE